MKKQEWKWKKQVSLLQLLNQPGFISIIRYSLYCDFFEYFGRIKNKSKKPQSILALKKLGHQIALPLLCSRWRSRGPRSFNFLPMATEGIPSKATSRNQSSWLRPRPFISTLFNPSSEPPVSPTPHFVSSWLLSMSTYSQYYVYLCE